MKKVLIASYTPYINTIDDVILKKYLSNAGAKVEIVSWDDDKCNWKDSTCVLIRSTWDSYNMLDKYKKWLDYLEKNNVKVYNDISIIKDNIFKERQINWLKQNNIPIMPCEVFSKNSFEFMKKPEDTLLNTIKKYFGSNKKMYILKPTFSAMTNDTYIIDPFNINKDDTFNVTHNYEELFSRLLNKYNDRGIILQEFSPHIKNGEYGLVFLNGKYVVGSKKIYGVKPYGKNLKDFDGSSDVIEFATNIINKLPKDKVKLARVDVIIDNGKCMVMELELADADLYFRRIDGPTFWIEDEKQEIESNLKKGCHQKVLTNFVCELLKEDK